MLSLNLLDFHFIDRLACLPVRGRITLTEGAFILHPHVPVNLPRLVLPLRKRSVAVCR